MKESYSQLQQKLKFDVLMKILGTAFQKIPEHRKSNARYSLANVLKGAFAMFSLKAPSLLSFLKQSAPEANNLRHIYLIEGAIPSDTQMREILDPVQPSHLRALFRTLFRKLQEAGVIRAYSWDKKAVIVSIIGTLTSWPSPVRSRCISAIAIANAACTAATLSAMIDGT